ncbi:hypothetical protein FB446DRAFT_707236 [Lentinula raphanica]|nr:hypothetical protein FB446DRAFT_707236 [Lentinula raphanica]
MQTTSNSAHFMRKNKNKPGPSGRLRDKVFTLHEDWGGKNFLMPVDTSIICSMREAMGGDSILNFVNEDFASDKSPPQLREVTGLALEAQQTLPGKIFPSLESPEIPPNS